jgi:hypothetical protein
MLARCTGDASVRLWKHTCAGDVAVAAMGVVCPSTPSASVMYSSESPQRIWPCASFSGGGHMRCIALSSSDAGVPSAFVS